MLLLLACAGDPVDNAASTSTGSTVDPATVALDGACDLADDLGGFAVFRSESGSGVEGAVRDGVVPIDILVEAAAEDDCRLLRRDNPYCEPACAAGETCDWDGACIAYPENQDLGVVTIDGLAQPVEMEPVFPGNTYFDSALPTPPFTPGDLITLDMPGGVYGPVTLHGVGVDALEIDPAGWSVTAGSPLEVIWNAPAGDPRSVVDLSIRIDQHGATPATLSCTFADDGAGTVPASIVDALVDSGVTGFPSGALERRTLDRVDVSAGCMDLSVSAPLTVEVDVSGYTPCTTDADCPTGLDCNEKMQICE